MPPSQKIVSGAIEEKLKAEQESQRMEFIITKGEHARQAG